MNPSVKNRSYSARVRTRRMGVHSRLAFRWTTTLLIAAMGFMPVCTGYAWTSERAPVTSAAKAGDSCCDTNQGNGCGTTLAENPAFDSCAPACAEPRQTVLSDAVIPSAGALVAASAGEPGRFEYPEKPPSLAAAPAAISSTPLIYHLQRLLI